MDGLRFEQELGGHVVMVRLLARGAIRRLHSTSAAYALTKYLRRGSSLSVDEVV